MVQAYGIFCKGKPSTLILMLALLPTFVSIVLMSFVRIYEANTVDDVKRLNGFPIVALIIAGYLMIILILENFLVCHHGHTLLRLFLCCFYLHHHLELQSKPRGRTP